ncbi:MAG: serine/threonine-protein phosphatase [bacterium]|nr:serine/threonine-protein phosphatase [bacterium]
MNTNNDAIDIDKTIEFLNNELKNFQTIATRLKPCSGDVPVLNGIDIFGEVIPYNSVVGGDHLIYVDFNKRYDLAHRIQVAEAARRYDVVEKLHLCKHRVGVMLADAAGHNITDALLAAMLHQAFLTGVQYELKENGEITSDLFEIINTRFFNSASLSKFITLIYGEISDAGKFSFINAGHPPPVVFSNEFNKLIKVCFERVIHFPPIGTLPSKEDIDSRRNFSRLGYKRKYSTNDINLMGSGDILFLFTDGFSEQEDDKGNPYFPNRLEEKLIQVKHAPAKEIYYSIKEDLLNFAKPDDDISFVIIKKI